MSLAKYLEKYKVEWLLILVFNVLCHGTMLLSGTIGIDTEAIILDREGLYEGWLNTGRAGLVLLKMIMGTDIFNPHLAGIGTLLFMTISCILWTYLFYRVTGKESKCGILIFSCILSSHTILTEQMYFKLQAMEIAACFCIVAIAVYLSHQFALNKKWYYIIGSLPLSVVAFGSYQAFNGLYIWGAVICFLLYYYFKCLTTEESVSTKQLWFYILRFATCFFLAFLLNQLLTVLFFSSSAYLESLPLWGEEAIGICLINIVKHMGKVLLGTKIFYEKTFAIYAILFMVLCGFVLFHNRTKNGKYLGVTVVALLFLSPFFLTIVCGREPVFRSQLTLPFVLAFMGYALFLFDMRNRKYSRAMRGVFVVIGVFTVCMQLKSTLLLNYTDYVRYQGDVQTAFSIMEDIDRLQDEERSYKLLFIGSRESQLNDSCIYGETIGYSLFDWDTEVEPAGYYSTRRIVGFMNALGAKYSYLSIDEVNEIATQCKDMSSWPMEGSVRRLDQVIVVKLSDFDE